MDGIFFLIVGLLIGAAAVFFVLRHATRRPTEGNGESFVLLQNQIENLARALEGRLTESRREMRESVATQFGESQKLMQGITERLLHVQKGMSESAEIGKQVLSITDQLGNLEKVLKHQKQRGNLGEASLHLTLQNILPPDAYRLEHIFKDGEKVDAAILTKEGMIPIDAKFSLDNYNRAIEEDDPARREVLERDFKNDLKRRIDETAKYIRPKEGTLTFAFMFIPAEGIYYDLLVNEVGKIKVNTRSLIDYAYRDKHVIIVSPTTFSAYLQSVLYGFRAYRIEESAREIGKQAERLERHLRAYEDYFKRVGISLTTASNHYAAAEKEFGKIDKDILKITAGSGEEDALKAPTPVID